MRFRGHDASYMSYDVRYEEYFERASLLGFVCQFRRTPPTMNHTALTALVDRWRPETHSFHLPCGEMTITLEDFAMITTLPIDGTAVTGRVDSDDTALATPVTQLMHTFPLTCSHKQV